jgi:hypothetical protein
MASIAIAIDRIDTALAGKERVQQVLQELEHVGVLSIM